MNNMITKKILARFISNTTLQHANIERNVSCQQFRLQLDGTDYATVDYKEKDNAIDLIHAIVPPHYKGQGIGNVLAEKTFNYIVGQNKRMILTCTFLQKFYKDNKEKYEPHVIE